MSYSTTKRSLDSATETDASFPLTHSSTLSALKALTLNVQNEFKHDLISETLIDSIKSRLHFLPEEVKHALVFNLNDPTSFITFTVGACKPQALVEGSLEFDDLHHSLLRRCVERNNSRRADYNAGRKFIADYRMFFELATGHYLNCDLQIHHSGMKFKPEYRIHNI